MKDQLVKIAQNIASQNERDEYYIENNILLASIAKKVDQPDLFNSAFKCAEDRLCNTRKALPSQRKQLQGMLIDQKETSEALSHCYYRNMFVGLMGVESEMHQLGNDFVRIVHQSCNFDEKIKVTNAMHNELSDRFLGLRCNIEQQYLFFKIINDLRKDATNSSQKRNITRLLRQRLNTGNIMPNKRIMPYSILKKLLALVKNGLMSECNRFIHDKGLSEALAFSTLALSKAADGKHTDAIDLINVVLASDSLSDSLPEERLVILYFFVLIAELTNSDEMFEISVKQVKQYLPDAKKKGEIHFSPQYFELPTSLLILSKLLRHQKIEEKDLSDILNESVFQYNGGSITRNINLGLIFQAVGHQKKALKLITKTVYEIVGDKGSDVFDGHLYFFQGFNFFLSNGYYTDAVKLLLLYEKNIVPRIMEEGDDFYKHWWFDRLYYCFEGDNNPFHKLFENLVKTEKNAEKYILDIKDDLVRDIGLVHLATKNYQDEDIGMAVWTLKLISAFPYRTAILHFMDRHVEVLSDEDEFSDFCDRLWYCFPNDQVEWLDGVRYH